jgi:hypothetical protein
MAHVWQGGRMAVLALAVLATSVSKQTIRTGASRSLFRAWCARAAFRA